MSAESAATQLPVHSPPRCTLSSATKNTFRSSKGHSRLRRRSSPQPGWRDGPGGRQPGPPARWEAGLRRGGRRADRSALFFPEDASDIEYGFSLQWLIQMSSDYRSQEPAAKRRNSSFALGTEDGVPENLVSIYAERLCIHPDHESDCAVCTPAPPAADADSWELRGDEGTPSLPLDAMRPLCDANSMFHMKKPRATVASLWEPVFCYHVAQTRNLSDLPRFPPSFPVRRPEKWFEKTAPTASPNTAMERRGRETSAGSSRGTRRLGSGCRRIPERAHHNAQEGGSVLYLRPLVRPLRVAQRRRSVRPGSLVERRTTPGEQPPTKMVATTSITPPPPRSLAQELAQ